MVYSDRANRACLNPRYVIHLLQMLEESIKVCFAHRFEWSIFAHVLQQLVEVSLIATRSRCLTSMGWRYCTCMSTLKVLHRLRWWKRKSWRTRPLLTPFSNSRKGMIGGSQTVQRHQHSSTCCVQCSPTHPNLVCLSFFLASSMQFTTQHTYTLSLSHTHTQLCVLSYSNT